MNEANAHGPEHRILVVDDSPSDLQFFVRLLRQKGYTVHPATAGAQALRFVQSTIPDLVLLDVQMPDMDGFELCERLKANDATHEVPVIFISGADAVLDKVKAFGMGAVDYIVKPFQEEEVSARIKTHLSLRSLQRELVAAKNSAEAASEAKSRFLTNMSHELRTPLNAILGFAQMLRRDPGLNERQLRGLHTIQQSGEHLLNLINELLDLAKVEAGKFELQPAAVDLPHFLQLVCDMARVSAAQRNLWFTDRIALQLPRPVLVDEKRLRQVLLNLLGNAVKFSDRGFVALEVDTLLLEESTVRLRFAVTDTGVGIRDELLERLFQPFEQVGDHKRRSQGAGLGLAISRALVRLMNGDIFVTSRLGEGSRFWFELSLPLAPAIQPAARQPTITGYQGPRKRVLVVEDSAGNRAMLADLLSRLGFEVAEAGNGREGLEQAQLQRPDLILMDRTMPGMGGIDTLHRLRQMPDLQDIPVFTVSASDSREAVAESMAAGANFFIGKPIHEANLLRAIGEYLELTWVYGEHDSP